MYPRMESTLRLAVAHRMIPLSVLNRVGMYPRMESTLRLTVAHRMIPLCYVLSVFFDCTRMPPVETCLAFLNPLESCSLLYRMRLVVIDAVTLAKVPS
jgi:hypothetical protein